MSAFYDTAKSLLKDFGFNIVINKYTTDSFDIENGSYTKTLDKSLICQAIYTQFKSGIFKESTYSYLDTDIKLLCQLEVGESIDFSCIVEFDNKEFKILNFEKLKFKEEDLIYYLYLRENKN